MNGAETLKELVSSPVVPGENKGLEALVAERIAELTKPEQE
jgi:hypothetical protein